MTVLTHNASKLGMIRNTMMLLERCIGRLSAAGAEVEHFSQAALAAAPPQPIIGLDKLKFEPLRAFKSAAGIARPWRLKLQI